MKVQKGDESANKSKFSILLEKEHIEHAVIIGCTVAIVLLLVSFGFSTYTFFKTKTEKTAEIGSLTGNLINLSATKVQLISDKGNLTLEIASLNDAIAGLNVQQTALVAERDALTAEKDSLTSQIHTLQVNNTALSHDLSTAQSDLLDCQDACP